MTLKSTFLSGAAALFLATSAFAADIEVMDPYARSSGPAAKAGAVFFALHNHGAEDDRLIAVQSDAAVRVELHTHKDLGDGIMKMMEVEEGFAVPASGMHMLERGGDHVMLMGLTAPLNQGDMVTLVLTFEKAGEVIVEVPVDLERKPAMAHGEGSHADHGAKDDAHAGHN